MKVQNWIFSVRCDREGERTLDRFAVVGPGHASTVEAALHLAGLAEDVRAAIRANDTVRKFIDGLLDPEALGYYTSAPCLAPQSWFVCIGSVQEIMR